MLTPSALTLALVDLAKHGQRPPCGEADCREWFTSDDPDERKRAAILCRICPLTRECLREGLETRATAGVWGGHDLERVRPSKRRQLLNELDQEEAG